MITIRLRWQYIVVALFVAGFMAIGSNKAADDATDHPVPATIVHYAKDLHWSGSPTSGAQSVVLYGDPSKPGLYIELTKWHAHNMSRPHYHPNDRFITVISGTWWKGQGSKYDPDRAVPIPAGSFAIDLARGIHYDGAKDGDTVIEIVGMGPATSTDAEVK